MLAAAYKKVLIAEPVRNLSSSHVAWLAKLSRLLTKPTDEHSSYSGARFNEETLRDLFKTFPAFQRFFFIPGGREMVGVFRGTHVRPA